MISTANKVRVISKMLDINLGEIASKSGMSQPNLSAKMKRGDLYESDIAKIANAMGCEVEVVFTLPDGTKV